MTKFVKRNLPRSAAIVKLHGYVKGDENLLHLNQKDLLLCDNLDCNIINVNEQDAQENGKYKRRGTYFMKDLVRMIILRAGMTQDSYYNRGLVHLKSSMLKTIIPRNSVLYASYPNSSASQDDKNATGIQQKGVWDQIQTMMAIGWDKESHGEIVSLFDWDASIIDVLKRSKAKRTLNEQKERMVLYLFETTLQLCLNPDHNISSNTGFEI